MQCSSEPIPFFSPPFVSGCLGSVKASDLRVRLTAAGWILPTASSSGGEGRRGVAKPELPA